MTTQQLVDSLLALIGDTPCIPLPPALGVSHVYLKLEGFNPTGTIYDRLILFSTFQGQDLLVTGSGAMCAAVALAGSVLQMPVTFQNEDQGLFAQMAEALGARRASCVTQNICFDAVAMIHDLIAEIQQEVPHVSTVCIPALPLLPTHLQESASVRLQWIPPTGSAPVMLSALARLGVLIDPQSASGVEQACSMEHEVIVVVCAIDGAMALAEKE